MLVLGQSLTPSLFRLVTRTKLFPGIEPRGSGHPGLKELLWEKLFGKVGFFVYPGFKIDSFGHKLF